MDKSSKMKGSKLPVQTLLGYLPDSLLDNLCLEHKVDSQVKKLHGKVVFKLLLYGILSSNELSLNVLISLFDKIGFRSLIGVDKDFTTKRNSLADRLTQIDSDYGKALFEESVRIFSKHLPSQKLHGYDIHLFDSTIVSCSAKLLDFGMQSGRKSKDPTKAQHQLKFTVGFNGSIAESIQFYDQQTHLADDVPLKDAIAAMASSSKDVAVFDRGLKARKCFEEFSQSGENHRLFVCRINPTSAYKVVEERILPKNQSETLEILSDQMVHLKHANGKLTKTCFRLITATKKDTPDEKLFFLTNILNDLEPWQVAHIYRFRWEIEKFFKFLKQFLNFSHFVSRDYNAIKLIAYIMLIAAMFIALYAKLNDMKGYKIVKLNFLHELEIEIVKELIIRCNGDPNLLNHVLKKNNGQ